MNILRNLLSILFIFILLYGWVLDPRAWASFLAGVLTMLGMAILWGKTK